MVVFHSMDDLMHLFRLSWLKLTPGGEASGETLSRADFLSRIGLFVSVVPFVGVLYGITKGRSRFRVEQVSIPSSNLPDAFHGLRIVQISDLHLGSFDLDTDIVSNGVDLINAQRPDLILFTGDLVNDVAHEAEPWVKELSRLEARLGKFSVLGNHDYADYVQWDGPEAKRANLLRLKEHHAAMGFRLLMDEHLPLEKDGARIGLLGCQNWGRGFQQYGDLARTMQGSEQYPFRILMSHDPTHWEMQVWGTGIDLTLSGHTHGAQFGVKIAGTTYSPAQWVYKHWAGHYTQGEQHLYVNRGFGFIGFPGRVGMPPEITVLELRQA
jgi:predicted MPP superfamily phosphohydrolase